MCPLATQSNKIEIYLFDSIACRTVCIRVVPEEFRKAVMRTRKRGLSPEEAGEIVRILAALLTDAVGSTTGDESLYFQSMTRAAAGVVGVNQMIPDQADWEHLSILIALFRFQTMPEGPCFRVVAWERDSEGSLDEDDLVEVYLSKVIEDALRENPEWGITLDAYTEFMSQEPDAKLWH